MLPNAMRLSRGAHDVSGAVGSSRCQTVSLFGKTLRKSHTSANIWQDRALSITTCWKAQIARRYGSVPEIYTTTHRRLAALIASPVPTPIAVVPAKAGSS